MPSGGTSGPGGAAAGEADGGAGDREPFDGASGAARASTRRAIELHGCRSMTTFVAAVLSGDSLFAVRARPIVEGNW
jgi:hypothetical protein